MAILIHIFSIINTDDILLILAPEMHGEAKEAARLTHGGLKKNSLLNPKGRLCCLMLCKASKLSWTVPCPT